MILFDSIVSPLYSQTQVEKEHLDWIRGQKEVQLPDGLLSYPLMKHQTLAVAFMTTSKRCILYDTTGAGKTESSIAAAILLLLEGKIKNCLIIVEPSIFKQWARRIKKCTDILPLEIKGDAQHRQYLLNKAKDKFFILTYYDIVLRDQAEYMKHNYDMVICDEASAFKNREAKTAKAIKEIAKRSKYFVALTATPIQNSPMDLYSILEAVNPTIFGDYMGFKFRYVVDKPMEVRKGSRVFRFRKIIGYNNLGEIPSKIRYSAYGRNLDELSYSLPEITQEERWLEFTPEQLKRYKETVNGVVQTGAGAKRVDLFAKFVYLLQLCDGVFLVDGSAEESAKFSELKRLLSGEYFGQKVVVFSQYKKMLAKIEEFLGQKDIKCVRITGDETKENREDNRMAFQDVNNDVNVLLMTVAGEMGLDLFASNILICVDRILNPARMTQLYGRIHRKGQTKACVVVHLLMENSIEVDVLDILRTKQMVIDEVFGGSWTEETLSADKLYDMMVREAYTHKE